MRTRSVRAIGVLAALLSCATQRAPAPAGSASSSTAARGPRPVEAAAPQRAELERVAALLDQANGCEDTGDLERAPPWAILGPSSVPSRPALQLEGLVEIAAGSSSPRLRALALLWLGSVGGPDQLAAIEASMTDPAAAGSFPAVIITQQVQAHYPVRWSTLTLEQVALVAASRIVARQFNDVAAYRAWRAAQGELLASFDYHVGQLEQVHDLAARREHLDALARRDPELYVRVAVMGDARQWGLDDAALTRATRAALPPDKLLDLLHRRTRWPEFATPERFAAFAAWALARWEALLGPAALRELARVDPFPDLPHLRQDLALALAAAYPDERRRVLTELIDAEPTQDLARALGQLARHHHRDELDRLARWFVRPPSTATRDIQLAILAELAAHGADARASLRRLALDPAFTTDEPDVLAALGATASATGVRLDGACDLAAMRVRAGKGTRTGEDERQAAASARRACVVRVTSALRR